MGNGKGAKELAPEYEYSPRVKFVVTFDAQQTKSSATTPLVPVFGPSNT